MLGETADRSITLATAATTGRGLYVGMTRGRDENVALVVTDELELAEAISILEAAIAIDRADIPATTHRRTLPAAVPRSRPQPRVEIPEWFDRVRAEAEEKRRLAQEAVDDRNGERAAERRRVADASSDLPVAEAEYAPFKEKVVAAEHVVSEARSHLRSAEYDVRESGRFGRRSARRDVEAATDVLAVANDRLARAEELAAPTRASVDDLRKIINDHRQFDSARQIFDEWNDLDSAADRANELCQALDQWKDWADGRKISEAALVEIALTLEDHQDLPGLGQLGEALNRWAEVQGIEVHRPTPPSPSLGMGIEL